MKEEKLVPLIPEGAVLAAEMGRIFIPRRFDIPGGRRLVSLISRLGRVYKPHPYDIPKDSYLVAAFALNHLLMMFDCGFFRADQKGTFFMTEEECVDMQFKIRNLLRRLESASTFSSVPKIYYQGDEFHEAAARRAKEKPKKICGKRSSAKKK